MVRVKITNNNFIHSLSPSPASKANNNHNNKRVYTTYFDRLAQIKKTTTVFCIKNRMRSKLSVEQKKNIKKAMHFDPVHKSFASMHHWSHRHIALCGSNLNTPERDRDFSQKTNFLNDAIHSFDFFYFVFKSNRKKILCN